MLLMSKRKYDFAGWVTKNDILCADGVVIKHDAFKHNDGTKVPLVWNHDYNSPTNVLGHIVLENRDTGVYGYGFLNETQEAVNAAELIRHGDISSMSIGAKKIKRSGNDVIHGTIYEVSLVHSGANPGAMIETVIKHSDDGEENEEGIIYTGNLIHSYDDVIRHEDKGGKEVAEDTKKTETNDDNETIGDVVETMNDKQKQALYALVGMAAEGGEEDNDDQEEDDVTVKQNVFSGGFEAKETNEVLVHSLDKALELAKENKIKLSEAMEYMTHADEDGETLQHGINSIEVLFPEAQQVGGNEPQLYTNLHTAYREILNGVKKSPFAKIKSIWADLTEDEARAKGYITGSMKKEEFFSLMKRETAPTTIYKKQKLDRDDIIDITDFNVVSFINREMRMMLEEEIARAILIGDGREFDDPDKIDETKIRPIINDNEFFTVRKVYSGPADFVEAVLLAKPEYRGSGGTTLFIDPALLVQIKMLKGDDGRYLTGSMPSDTELAAQMGVSKITETTWMTGKGALLVNLSDYSLGANKGGQITNFDDFDIDFNQYKYLIETRLSGSLTLPKSAFHFTLSSNPDKRMSETDAQLSWGKRQADRLAEETEPEE